jgi:hypothetical protein
MHPLTQDLSQLKDDELHKKIHELTQRLTQSYRFGNYDLVGQIHMMLEDYQEEANRRQRKLLDDLAQKNNKFDGIIDIK